MSALLSAANPVLLDDVRIRGALSAAALSSLANIHLFPALPSTNEWLLEKGSCGEVCLAEQQTAGRGRRGRVWLSPAQQNIYLSLRWCYPQVPPNYGSLGLAIGLAVCRALDDLGVAGHGLKWPNDIYHQQHKLGGILLQTAQPLQQVVIGIGLNVNMQTESAAGIDQPWCSLRGVTGESVDRNYLVALLLNQLVSTVSAFPKLQRDVFAAEWRSRDVLADRAVTVHQSAGQLTGIARGIDTSGSLLVELESGVWNAFSAVDVSVRL